MLEDAWADSVTHAFDVENGLTRTAFSPSSNAIQIANSFPKTVSVIDSPSYKVSDTTSVTGETPLGIVITVYICLIQIQNLYT